MLRDFITSLNMSVLPDAAVSVITGEILTDSALDELPPDDSDALLFREIITQRYPDALPAPEIVPEEKPVSPLLEELSNLHFLLELEEDEVVRKTLQKEIDNINFLLELE